jgi:2-methylcitrate dehydratase
MEQTANSPVQKASDGIQQHLTDFAFHLDYASLPPAVIHGAKVRIIDTLGALIGGFHAEPCRLVRSIGAQFPNPDGATILGTRMKTTPDMAAFVNGTSARNLEITDAYFWPGSYGGHPSDVVTPILGCAEHAQAGGRELITSVVIGYEVFIRLCDVFHNFAIDHTNMCCLGSALGAAKIFGLSAEQMSHTISMAVVPNVILRQVRLSHQTLWKAVATGHAGRAGVFAALLAKAGMEGPHLPFEGKAGWCDHVAMERFSLAKMGGNGTPFKILDTRIKYRSCSGNLIAPVLCAEKVSRSLKNIDDVKQVIVEVHARAKETGGTGEHTWNPQSRETADHSAPYLIAATLMDGTINYHSFDDNRLWNPALRSLMQKVEVVENEEFTKAYKRLPVEQCSRVTVITANGERLVGESGADKDGLSTQTSDEQVTEKFRGFTEEYLGAKHVSSLLDRLWNLEKLKNIAEIPPALVVV